MHADIEAVAVLSPMQQGLLFHTLLDPDAAVYVNQHAISLRGPLDPAAFVHAWRGIVSRHQIFRASFHWEQVDTAMMAIWREAAFDVDVLDWREAGQDEQRTRLRAFLARDRRRGFELTAAPLMRMTLFRRSEDEWWCAWSNHHLVLDGWSAALVAREAFLAYAAYREGRSLALPDAPAFTDYLAWLARQDLTAAETFWRRELGNLRTIASIAGERDVPADAAASRSVDDVHGVDDVGDVDDVDDVDDVNDVDDAAIMRYGQRRLRLSREETRTLQHGARRLGTTLSVLAQAAWALVVSQHTRESDIVIGVTSSGRPPEVPAIESMAGLFINTLPLRLRVARHQSIAALVAQTHERNVRMRAVEFSPLASVQTWSGLPAGTPLFESIVVFENYPVDRLLTQTVADLAIEGIEIDEATNYPLTVTIGPGPELLLQITFETARFSPTLIERLLRHYRAALLAFATQPDQRVGDVCLLDASEWEQVRSTWQGARTGLPLEDCLHHWIERQADRTPDAIAIRFEGASLSYADLDARANRLARELIDGGVRPGALVGVAMERSLELVIALLAVLEAGGAYVPLDPDYPHDRLRFQIADASAPVVLTQRHLAARFETLLSDAAMNTRVIVVDAGALADGDGRAAEPRPQVGPDHPAYVIYTSGSTGQPKGVVNTHRAICNRLIWMQQAFPLDLSDRVLQKTPYSFDVSVWEFFWPLMTGATLVVVRPGGHRDAAYLAGLIADERITTIHFVPPMLEAMLEEPRFDRCASLKRVICSGEALTWDVQQRFFNRSRAELHNLYGPTEAAVDVTWWACRPEPMRIAVPIGRPISNLEIFLLNEDLQPAPVGVPGELWIGGVGLAQGYWRRPSLTAERFAPHPFSHEPGARLYRTGDLARYRDDGAIEYLGRLDHQVKIRGHRIELGEIEAALGTHPAVRQAVVLATGDGANRQLVTCIVGGGAATNAAGGLAQDDDLRAHLARTLPPYMVPDLFVRLDTLPLTHNGKVDRRALADAIDTAPAAGATEPARERIEPRTALERELLACWIDVLKRPAIGVTESFFALGGHSLLATRLVSRIRSRLGIDLPLRALFEAPTIERLARAIGDRPSRQVANAAKAADAAGAAPLTRVSRDGDLPLSLAQERLWYVAQLDASGVAYNIPLAFDLDGPLDADVFEQSLLLLVARHEPLRTSISMVDGRPVQRVHANVPFHLERFDLSGPNAIGEPEKASRLAEIANEVAGRPFDLARAPLFRAALVRLDAARHRFVMALHHLVADGASIEVLARELTECYAALREGSPPRLPNLSWQYIDYATSERNPATAADEGDSRHLEAWMDRLRDTPRLPLPYDRARPAIQTFRGGVVVDVVPASVTARVQAIGAARQASPFATLLAAFSILLARVTGQHDICVGTPLRNRPRAELDSLVGLFVNTVALRTRVDPREPFGVHVERTRDTVLHAQEHGHVPFDRVVEALQLARDSSRQPLVDVMFLLTNPLIGDLRFGDVQARPVDVATTTAKFDLLVTCQRTDEGLRVAWEFNADLFDAATIARLASAFACCSKRSSRSRRPRCRPTTLCRPTSAVSFSVRGPAVRRPYRGRRSSIGSSKPACANSPRPSPSSRPGRR